MPGLIAYVDSGLRYRFSNSQYEGWFGLSPDQIIGRHLQDVLGRTAFENVRPHAEAALAGRRVTFEAEMPFKHGGTRHVRSEFVPEIRPDGSVAGYYSLVLDVTSRTKAELALRESEELCRLALESGGMGVWRWDTRQQSIRADEPFQRFWGLSSTDQPHSISLYYDQMSREDAAAVKAVMARELVPGEEISDRVQVAAGPNAGRWVQWRGRVDSREPWIINGVSFDITAQVLADDRLSDYRMELEQQVRDRTAELQASRDLLQATMDASTEMIQVFEAVRDDAGAIVDFRWRLNNHASELRYGEVIGERLLQRNPGVVVEGIFDTFKRVTESGRPARAERHYVHEQFDGWFYQSAVKLGDGVATTTTDITDWKAAQADLLRLQDEIAQAKLRESEERFRLLVESVRDYAIFTTDKSGIITSWPAGAEAVFGWSEDEMLGSCIDRTFLPEDVASGAPEIERQTAMRDGWAPNIRWHVRKDGSRIFIDGSTQPLKTADGTIREFIKIGQDVTAARRLQQALVENEERLRSAGEVGRLGLWDWNVVTNEIHWSDEHFRMEGYAIGEVTPSYEAWAARIHPEDRPQAEEMLRRAMDRAEEFVHEFRVVHPDGSIHWLSGRGRFFYNDQHQPIRMIGAMIETTERREWEDRQAVMVAELQHRTRNLIAVVRSIAGQTMAHTGPTEAFRDEFNHRLEALARVQGLLSRSDDQPITIETLIRMELDALGAADELERVHVHGPPVRIRHSVVQTLALALHELATNARKYGALSNEQGQLEIRWRTYAEAKGDRLTLEWIESGGQPPAPAGDVHRGYGRELIQRALPYSLNARTSFEHDETGLRCIIDMPLQRPRSRRNPQ